MEIVIPQGMGARQSITPRRDSDGQQHWEVVTNYASHSHTVGKIVSDLKQLQGTFRAPQPECSAAAFPTSRAK